jgi:hypothetical protein
MHDIDELTTRYIAVWNEPDPDARRAAVAGIWSEDALVYTEPSEYSGLAAIQQRVAAAYEKWVKQEGYLFRATTTTDAHHDGIRLRWEMVPAAGGAAASTGVQFLLLDPAGLVRCDYQFVDPAA